MTPKQQRIAIAEACGWIFVNETQPKRSGWFRDGNWLNRVHRYDTDLNAMHDAEKFLVTANQRIEYRNFLQDMAETDWPIQATAAERAEAFLRTIGKWNG